MGRILLTFIILLVSIIGKACPVVVHVRNHQEKSVAGISIVVDGTLKGRTNSQGTLQFELEAGSHHISLKKDTASLLETDIVMDCSQKNRFSFKVDVSGEAIALTEVSVKMMTAKKTIDVSPFSVQAIGLRKYYSRGGDVSQVLNQASGVKLRSDGNIGAPVQINLGGLQGKAVRLFRDGIPIELFGHGFGLGTIPVNMLERVEIYKGVMPLYLASDALGGGINLVSRQDHSKFAELSYELGSFNTHRATLNALWQNKSGKFYLGTNSSFNYSDNSYTVNVPFLDAQTSATTYKDTKRFHDATNTYYAEGYAGLKHISWADDLRLTLINSSFYKEIQNDAEMNKVYGEPYSKEKNYTGLLNYRKTFLHQRLRTNVLGTYSFFKTRFVDTAKVRYGWDNQIIGKSAQPGEINMGNDQRLDYHFLFSRLNVSYELSDKHALDFSALYSWQKRKGSDPLGAITAVERLDVLKEPSRYAKGNMALGLRSFWLDKEFESILAIKYYQFNTNGFTADNSGLGWRSSGSDQQLGYLAGLRWNRGPYLVKLSYERATRLPDEYEIFGDAVMTAANMDLKPERSHNVNLNAQYSITDGERSFTLSGGLFYRKVQDIIFLQLDIPFSRYINYEHSEVKGFELEANYAPVKRIDFGTNLTYQDIRRVDIKEAMFRNMEGSRVPNVPFFFGNFWLNLHFKQLFHKADRLELNWNGTYTHRFFLKAISKDQEPGLFEQVKDFQTSLVIPRDGRLGQLSNNAGIYYHFGGQRISLSGECRNIGNVRLYDNFNVQRPGRSFHVKLVYQFF